MHITDNFGQVVIIIIIYYFFIIIIIIFAIGSNDPEG